MKSLTINDIIRFHIHYYVRGLNIYEDKRIISYVNGVARIKGDKSIYAVSIKTSDDNSKLTSYICTCPTKHRICKHTIATFIYHMKGGYKPLSEYETSVQYAYLEIESMIDVLYKNKRQAMEKVLQSLSEDKINWKMISNRNFEKHGLLITELEKRLVHE
jgi:hypothetical protein